MRNNGRAVSMLRGTVEGALIGLLILAGVLGITAVLIYNGKMKWDTIGYAEMAGILAASCIGAQISFQRVKRRKLQSAMITGLIMVLLMTVLSLLLFHSAASGTAVTGMLVLSGCVAATVMNFNPKTHRKKRGVKGAKL